MERLRLIDAANAILEDYRRQGYVMTLRQVYYQLVDAKIIPNNVKAYKRLGGALNAGRLAGMIDWDLMEDRLRNLEERAKWDDPPAFMDSVIPQYHIDMWANQDVRVEVWIEKDALAGVIERVCREHSVPYFACRGYTSQSEQYTAGLRLGGYEACGQSAIVLHLGDHDPSGMDMTRDNRDRLAMFSGYEIEVRRLALNYDQIEELRLPPDPAKPKDSRTKEYAKQFGRVSWELDALKPPYLVGLIEDEIATLKDPDRWDEKLAEKAHAQDYIRRAWAAGVDSEGEYRREGD